MKKLITSQQPIMRRLKAFTLIELAIVLVIVGLLVGGVLQGRELIEGSKRAKYIKDLSSYQTAYNTFRLKYNCMPGDCRNASAYFPTAQNGNGDRMYFESGFGFAWASLEGKNAIDHLSQAGLINFRFNGTRTTKVIDINSVEESPYQGSGYKVGYIFGNGYPSDNLGATNFLASICVDGSTFIDHGCMEVLNSKLVDDKIDDGLPLSGNFRTINSSWSSSGCLDGTLLTSGLSKTLPYTINTNAENCITLFSL